VTAMAHVGSANDPLAPQRTRTPDAEAVPARSAGWSSVPWWRVMVGCRCVSGPGVVGRQALDSGDVVLDEVGSCAGDESHAGAALLIGQDLVVGQPGVVIDEAVDVVVAGLVVLVALGAGGCPSVGSPVAPSGSCRAS